MSAREQVEFWIARGAADEVELEEGLGNLDEYVEELAGKIREVRKQLPLVAVTEKAYAHGMDAAADIVEGEVQT